MLDGGSAGSTKNRDVAAGGSLDHSAALQHSQECGKFQTGIEPSGYRERLDPPFLYRRLRRSRQLREERRRFSGCVECWKLSGSIDGDGRLLTVVDYPSAFVVDLDLVIKRHG